MYKRLYQYGVKAVFYTSSDGHRDIPYVYANYSYMDEPFTIPTAILKYDDAMELAKREDVEIFLQLPIHPGNKSLNSADDRSSSIDLNGCSHLCQFIHIAKTIFKNTL